jgi:tRNA pseudouridine55 synthase
MNGCCCPWIAPVAKWPAVTVFGDSPPFYLRQGQPVLVPRAPTRVGLRLYQGNELFLGIGEILDDGRVAPRRLLGNDLMLARFAC